MTHVNDDEADDDLQADDDDGGDEDILDGELADDDDDDLRSEKAVPNSGSFNDRNSIFASKGNPREREDPRNPVITRQQESDGVYEIIRTRSDNATVVKGSDIGPVDDPGIPESAGPQKDSIAPMGAAGDAKLSGGQRKLIAKFDKYDRPFVAWFVDGKQSEPFRPATPQERTAIKTRGKLVAGGALGVVGADDVATTTPSAFPIKKVLLWGAGIAVVGGVAYWVWKKNKADADADVRSVRG